jgi:hypothetical protein
MLARSAAAQQELVPIQPLKRLRDPLGGRCGCPVNTAIGIERSPNRCRAQAQRNDEKQTSDKLEHEAHAITPKFGKLSLTTPPRLANCRVGPDCSSGKFPKPDWAWLFGPGAAALI